VPSQVVIPTAGIGEECAGARYESGRTRLLVKSVLAQGMKIAERDYL